MNEFFSKAVQQVLATQMVREDVKMELASIAYQCDSLRDDVVTMTNRAAKRLQEISNTFKDGETYTSNPLANGDLSDLPSRIAKLDVTQDALRRIFCVAVGVDDWKEVKKLVQKAYVEREEV